MRRGLFIVSGTALMRNRFGTVSKTAVVGEPPKDVRCQRDMMLWFLDVLGSLKDVEIETTIIVIY
jgi:hypothetical protein